MTKEESVMIAFRASPRDRDLIERAMYDLGLLNRSEIIRRIIRDWEKHIYSRNSDDDKSQPFAEQ